MIFKTELQIEGSAYLINKLSFEIMQEVDKIGRPSSVTKGGKIELEMNVVEDDLIADWMVKPTKTLNGTIVFYENNEDNKAREIKFEEAFCYEFTEKFDEEILETGMVTAIKISAKKLIMGNIELTNNWLK